MYIAGKSEGVTSYWTWCPPSPRAEGKPSPLTSYLFLLDNSHKHPAFGRLEVFIRAEFY